MERTIALIDDSLTIRTILRKAVMMSDVGAKSIVEADNGLDGLELIKKLRDQLQLVIMDLKMPKMDGLQVLTELRNAGINSVPIVVLSSTADNQVQATCKSLGARAFLKKPFSHEDFKAVLDSIFAGLQTA
ncbi:MAG TPA: response regulator [bacterium]|nr:response regulator [bacterium]